MLRIGLYTARPLGWKIASIVGQSPAIQIVGHNHEATGWWGKCGDDLDTNVFATQPDLVISALTHKIFRPEEIAACPIVNLHLAPLPQYRGCNGIAHAIMNGDKSYGVTIHHVDKGIDTGSILARSCFPIAETDTGISLYEKVEKSGLQLFVNWWKRFLMSGLAPGTPQDQTQARYYRRDSLLPYFNLKDWPVAQHPTIIRALTFPPFPLPHMDI